MRIFFMLIMFCSVIFASIPDISFVSRNNQHLIVLKAALENPQISYESKGNDLVIAIKSPSIETQDISSVKQFDNSFVVSAMATRINTGNIKILLKDSKFSVGDIQVKQKDDEILFYLTSNSPANSVEQKSEIPEEFPLNLVVLRNTVNLRQLPSSDAEVAGKSLQGETLIATQKKGQWYAVKNRKGVPAWVHEDVVAIAIEEQKPSAPTPTRKQATKQEEIVAVQQNEYIISTENKKPTGTKPLAMVIDSTPKTEVKDTLTIVAPKKVFSYTRKGRDPFLPLDKSDFIREGLPNINNITLVGILYDSQDAIALFEERRGNEITSFSMKIGDPVVSGKLLKIEADKVVFLLREATFSYTVDKELNVN